MSIDEPDTDVGGWHLSGVASYDMENTGIAGDYAVGTGWEGGMYKLADDGFWCVVRWLYYVEPVKTDNLPVVRDAFVVQRRMEFTWCTDVDDPGGTEVDAEYTYDAATPLYYDDLADAESDARAAAAVDYRFIWENWNGVIFIAEPSPITRPPSERWSTKEEES